MFIAGALFATLVFEALAVDPADIDSFDILFLVWPVSPLAFLLVLNHYAHASRSTYYGIGSMFMADSRAKCNDSFS